MATRRILFTLFVLGVCFFGISRLPASGDEWQPIDPADLKMTSEPKAPGAPAIFLYRQVDRTDSDRASTEYNYVRIKILTEQGRDLANVVIPYYEQDASIKISNIRARSISPDGKVTPFDGKVFDKVVEKKKGEKVKAKVFTIPDVQVGSIIEYHFNYDFEDRYIFDSYWPVSDELFTRLAQFTLKPYPRWYVRWAWPAGLPPGTDPPKEGSDGIVRMTAHDVAAFQQEEFMPPANELKFRVIFIYSEESFESDPAKYWKKYGKKRYDSLESFIGKRKELEAAVSQMVSPGDSEEVKLRKIYDHVQQIRNLSFEPPKSEEERKRGNEKKIENAADILKYGYGSGFDLTWLFVGLARAAGFEASGGFVATRNSYFFNKARMNSDELNSNVAIVKVGGKDVYFDPGAKFVPYGLLPWYETNVEGMKLTKDGGAWIHTDLPASSASEVRRTADFKMDQEGNLEGKVTVSYTGLEALFRRVEFHNQDDEARKKYLEEVMKDYIPVASEVELTNKPEWNASEPPLTAEYNVKIPGWVSGAGHRALMAAGVFSGSEKHMFEHSNRTNAVYFEFPYRKTDDVTFELPAGWKVETVPQDTDLDAKAAEYTLKVTQKESRVQVARVLRVDLLMVPKDLYPALYGFYQKVKSSDDQQVVLQPSAAAASN